MAGLATGRIPQPALMGFVVFFISVTCMAAVMAPCMADGWTSKVAFTSGETPERIFGVFPYLAPRELEIIYAPIAAEFSRATGEQVFFSTNSTFRRFRQNLNREMYDIVFVQPFFYIEIADKFGYEPIAVRNESLPAMLVVDRASEYRVLDDLRGKVIALPPQSAAMSYLIKDFLDSRGYDLDRDFVFSHHRSHATCMQQVLIGAAAACGTAPPALRFFREKMNVSFRKIVETPSIPNSLFAVHPRVPAEVRRRLKKNIINWSRSDKGRDFLHAVKVKAFRETRDSEYDVVRKLEKKSKRN